MIDPTRMPITTLPLWMSTLAIIILVAGIMLLGYFFGSYIWN